jgi:serine/threonine protein kinase
MSIIDKGGFGKIYVIPDGNLEFVIKKGLDSDISQEAHTYRKLHGVPGIPRLYDYWTESEVCMVRHRSKSRQEVVKFGYLRLEQLGLSLRRIARLQPLKLATVREWGCQLVRTLNLIHQRGVVHRDVKPDNMVCGLRDRSNQIFLVDFGLASRHRKYKKYPDDYFCGTPGYTSQNINRHIRPSYRDDMESLGYSLYYLVYRPLPKPPNEIADYREFEPFIRYCRSLTYGEVPDPDVLCGLLRSDLSPEDKR